MYEISLNPFLTYSSANRKSKNQRLPRGAKWVGLVTLALTLAFSGAAVEAQPAKPERIGVIHLGEVFATLVDGLRAGLKELGLQDGKQFVLEVHDLKGDLKSAPRVAETLEREKVKLIFTNTTPITSDAFKATKNIPIVFAVGSDPVASGFAKSFGQPGGRLTGIQYLARDLTGKRLEILKEFLPKLRQVVAFYDPGSTIAVEGFKLGRAEAQRINIKLAERQVKSIDEINGAPRRAQDRRVRRLFVYARPHGGEPSAAHCRSGAGEATTDDVSRSGGGGARCAGELWPELFRDRPAFREVRPARAQRHVASRAENRHH